MQKISKSLCLADYTKQWSLGLYMWIKILLFQQKHLGIICSNLVWNFDILQVWLFNPQNKQQKFHNLSDASSQSYQKNSD